jgi:hypothetical protein
LTLQCFITQWEHLQYTIKQLHRYCTSTNVRPSSILHPNPPTTRVDSGTVAVLVGRRERSKCKLLLLRQSSRGRIMKPKLSAGKELLFASRPATRLPHFNGHLGCGRYREFANLPMETANSCSIFVGYMILEQVTKQSIAKSSRYHTPPSRFGEMGSREGQHTNGPKS